MEFFNILLPVHIKYDLVTDSDERQLQKVLISVQCFKSRAKFSFSFRLNSVSKYGFLFSFSFSQHQQWTECRLNMQPAENSNRGIQAFCYPPNYDDLLPYFMSSIDYAAIRLGSVTSRSKSHTYGLFWDCGSKKCRILLAFQSKDTKKRYANYLKNMLALFRSQHEFENSKFEQNPPPNQTFF